MAMALTKPLPLSGHECARLFTDYGRVIFHRSAWRTAWTLDGLVAPKYDGEGLRRVLYHAFAADNLAQCSVPTFVTAYDLGVRLPTLLRSWAPSAPRMAMVDVGLATSAAPTYFPPATLNGAHYIDGGVFCNNPALDGVIEGCLMHGLHTRDCLVLSIGTGSCKAPFDPQSTLEWGKVGWVRPLIDITLDGGPDHTHCQMMDLLPDGQYLAVDPVLRASEAILDNYEPSNLASLARIAETAIDLQRRSLVALLDRL